MSSLQIRAQLYKNIRSFFAARNVLEVETPLLCSHTVTDAYIDSFIAGSRDQVAGRRGEETGFHDQASPLRYLQTSPEYCMKRLLAHGSGPIFQICKAFRLEEAGGKHNPEFSMLEWYRPGFSHHDLINEIDELIQATLNCKSAEKHSYQACFMQHANLDPFSCETTKLHNFVEQNLKQYANHQLDHDTLCQIILSEYIEPKIGIDRPYFIYDFPTTQAALAKIRQETPPVAERFELFYKGYELANGFHELTDATEQEQRFKDDQQKRLDLNKTIPKIDNYFIDALKSGLPECSGVAIGLDRLVMLKGNFTTIQEALSFDWQSC